MHISIQMKFNFSDLPNNTRVKLSDQGRQDLWHRVDEFGGVQSLSQSFDFSASKMYNWKNKDSYMPKSFIKRIMGENPPEVAAVKGEGRGKKWETGFPVEISEELLTRADSSVVVNENGIPFYLTDELSLAHRFSQLLERNGIAHQNYNRDDRYEVRYPKFIHSVISNIDFNRDFAALVDEEGVIEEGKLKARTEEVKVENFDGELYSRSKIFELALFREDEKKITEIMSQESNKVRKMIE